MSENPRQHRVVEILEELAKAMEKLSLEHRMVLSLFAVDELSHKEIAGLLAVPEGTVWSRLAAARKSLHALRAPMR